MFVKLKKGAATGQLTEVRKGLVHGEISGDVAEWSGGLTVEILVHGITLKKQRIDIAGRGKTTRFTIPLEGFPDVALPCQLRARIVESDTLLESDLVLNSLEQVWAEMMPFRARIAEVTTEAIYLDLEGEDTANPTFELRSWGRPVAQGLRIKLDQGQARYRIDLPSALLDGADHRLSVVHVQSGLPLSERPIDLQALGVSGAGMLLETLAARLTRLEAELREMTARAFQTVAAPLYLHIDQLAHLQRSNFEAEISALRGLLGVEPGHTPTPTNLPGQLRHDFEAPVCGYGLHEVTVTSTGKAFRWVAPASGIILPGMLDDREMELHLQGLRRSHTDALLGARLHLNGAPLEASLYLNPKSESWNMSATLAPGSLRRDRNLLELRLPNGIPEGIRTPDSANKAAGIMFIELTGPNTLPGSV